MAQAQTLSLSELVKDLGLPKEQAKDFLNQHSVEEIDAMALDIENRKEYAKILCVDLEKIRNDSQETLDAKASVSLQKDGDLAIGFFGLGCPAVGYGIGELVNLVTTQDSPNAGIAMAIGSAALWGTVGTLISIGQYHKAWKHYNKLSPEMKKEVGRPWPLKQYAKAAAYTAKGLYNTPGVLAKGTGVLAKGIYSGMKAVREIVRERGLYNTIKDVIKEGNRGMKVVYHGLKTSGMLPYIVTAAALMGSARPVRTMFSEENAEAGALVEAALCVAAVVVCLYGGDKAIKNLPDDTEDKKDNNKTQQEQ